MTLEQIYQHYVQRNGYTWEEKKMYTAPAEGQLLFVQTETGGEYRFVFFKGSSEPYVRTRGRGWDDIDSRLFNFFSTHKGADCHSYNYIYLTPPQ